MHLEAEAANEGAVVHALLAQDGNVVGTLNEQGIQLVILRQEIKDTHLFVLGLGCTDTCGPRAAENPNSDSCHLL